MSGPAILLTNDDGVESPALVALSGALASLGEVRVVAPDRERSWVSKAVSRRGSVTVTPVTRGGVEMLAVTGFPADCVQLGVFNLFERPPELVVSGINIGANHGQSFVMSSGTVGAAIEAAIVGVPAMAFSAVASGEWATWSSWAAGSDSTEMWNRLASIAGEVIADVLEGGFPTGADVIKVEMPAAATTESPRAITSTAPVRYGRLFEQDEDGAAYHYHYRGGIHPVGPLESTDLGVVRDGCVAITPLTLDMTGSMDDELLARLERS